MLKEVEFERFELENLAAGLMQTFIQRHDLYARQLDDGRYVCVRRPLRQSHLLGHLKGDLTLGTYVLDSDSQARFIVFDADEETHFDRLVIMARRLAWQGLAPYLETSRRGGHLWLFLPQSIPGKLAREFGHGLSLVYNLEEIELFPKQDELKNGPGSLVRMPFGVHRRTGERYGLINPEMQSIALSIEDQIRILSQPQTVPQPIIDAYRALRNNHPIRTKKAEIKGTETATGTLSERIKGSISALDFIGRYVELSPNGRGHCPFHDDQHKSFSVNTEKNYWYCFAGCGGGSIIDFWMKRQDCDFKQAIKELAEILLKDCL